MGHSRRFFLKSSGVAVVGLGLGPGLPGFLTRAAAQTAGKGKVLVVLFQRGAADGLNMVVPHGEKAYYAARPTIAIPRPARGKIDTALDLDGFFGLHPSLAPLQGFWKDERLAIVTAAGSPDSTRSHFDAQDFMETGTPGIKSTADGWLNRYLQVRQPADPSSFRAVSMTSESPRVLKGPAPTLAIPELSKFGIQGGRAAEAAERGLLSLYENSDDPLLAPTARETFEAMEMLERADPGQYRPANGADYPPGGFGRTMLQIAQLIKADIGVEIAFAEVGGWDLHVNEGGVRGPLSNLLRSFGGGIAAFVRDLGDWMDDVVVLTLSEFGRTVAENGNRGTDHGHANSYLVVGGGVAGGRVHGEWPGLDREQLHEGRDLALTTDFRDVIAELLVGHLGATDLSRVFPGYPVDPRRFRGLVGSVAGPRKG